MLISVGGVGVGRVAVDIGGTVVVVGASAFRCVALSVVVDECCCYVF